MNASSLLYWPVATPCLASVQLAYWLLWGGSLAVTVTLIVLLLTKWGHSQPLHKCAVLSLIVHLMLATLTMTVRIVNGDGTGGGGGGAPIHVRIVEEAGSPHAKVVANATVEKPATKSVTEVAPPPLLDPPTKPDPPKQAIEPVVEKTPTPEVKAPAKIVAAAPKVADKHFVEPKVAKEKAAEPKPIEKVAEEPKVVAEPTPPQPAPTIATATPVTELPKSTAAQQSAPPAAPTEVSPIVAAATPADVSASNVYALRNAPGRLGLVAGQGGNAETEASVAAALRWLAAAQSKDGRWDAVQFGGGQEEMTLGQNRGGAGRNADTGVTALALLAFLGAGHSHLQGEYQDNVRRGLDFLLRTQAADGNLFGDATLYAQMYCHSMATFALAEAQALTSDQRLEPAVTKAVNFSLAAQDKTTGGWRYRPGDPGDTSQLGWQIMALTSAQRAGIDVPDQTWSRIERFLRSVERGNSGGLASYRPDSPASTSMTAEALYCRLMLQEASGTKLPDRPAAEATTQLLATPPSVERSNLYYWYYATLALHHRQHSNDAATAAWHTWNDAMTAALTKSQATEGDAAGSWDSNTIWGGYGGRIYTTAMATMCLEVYYRYAPAAGGGMWSASRPQAESHLR